MLTGLCFGNPFDDYVSLIYCYHFYCCCHKCTSNVVEILIRNKKYLPPLIDFKKLKFMRTTL